MSVVRISTRRERTAHHPVSVRIGGLVCRGAIKKGMNFLIVHVRFIQESARSIFCDQSTEMDAEKVSEDSARSISSTPINSHHHSRADLSGNLSSVTEKDRISHFSLIDDGKEAHNAFCPDANIAWQNLEMQLMNATIQDKELSELCFQRAIQRQSHVHTLIFERKSTGSWSSLVFLLLGVVPPSLFIFALACTIHNINIVYPQ